MGHGGGSGITMDGQAAPRSSSSVFGSYHSSSISDHSNGSINSSSRLQEIGLVGTMVGALVPQAHRVC